MLQLTTIFCLIATAVLATLHIIALKLFLYWQFWWFDIPMHALGGVTAALGAFTLYDLRVFRNRSWLNWLPVLLFVFGVAISWEIYEWLIGVPLLDRYLLDTVADVIVGLIGGYLGWIVGSRVRKL